MHEPLTYFSPAKLNLFLAITGRRSDGFHDLVSVVAKLKWGDTLTIAPAETDALECDDPAVPVDASNLVLKAAAVFREATGWRGAAKFVLQKRIPMGAGLGGGSSNGAIALRALNDLAGRPLDDAALVPLAAKLGSDCAAFLTAGPVVMRGRGERIEALPEASAARLSGRRVLVFKPSFGISTPWAYQQMAARAPDSYCPEEEAQLRLQRWIESDAAAEALLYNNMESVAFEKFIALPTMLEELRGECGLAPRMSGSGSACFAFLPEGADASAIAQRLKDGWGGEAVVIDSRLE